MEKKVCGGCRWWSLFYGSSGCLLSENTHTLGKCHYNPQAVDKYSDDYCSYWTSKIRPLNETCRCTE